MKVLVADKLEASALDGLKRMGCDVVVNPDLADDSLVAAVGAENPDVLIVRGTKVPKEAINAGANLALIIRAGAGYNTIDVEAATAKGAKVANCPGKNAIAVAELAFALILALDRHIPDCAADMRNGVWNKKAYSKAKGLAGLTIGLVGFGNISQEMVARCKAFGMEVHVYSSHLQAMEADDFGVTPADSAIQLAERCDIVSVHCSLTPATKGLLGKEFFAAMKPGAYFINTSRAEVVDQAALLDAVANKGIKAGLDVFENEPTTGEGSYEGPLKGAQGVICTHHIGAGTDQAQEAVAAEVVRIVAEYQATGVAPNTVN